MNDRERPRVLAWVQTSDDLTLFNWASEKSGTFKRITGVSQVDLTEWDVLITDGPHAEIAVSQYGLLRDRWGRVPEHLFIFRVFASAAGNGKRYFEFKVSDDGQADPDLALSLVSEIPGHKMERVSGLPEPIQDLVKTELLPSIERRSKQFGIHRPDAELAPAVLKWRPFLFGPGGLVMAASYERPGGRSVWLVPKDAKNLPAWFDAALSEWHLMDARTFPNITTWQTDPRWDTADEIAARSRLQEIEDAYAAHRANFEKEREAARVDLSAASKAAVAGPKSLLTAQDDPLQDAVFQGLQHLGFEVEDMDLVWPERERREDFRIRDSDEPAWLVLADATGVAKGAPGSKITTVVGYVAKFIIEDGAKTIPGVWIIVNRLFHRDPMTRGDVYRSDDLAVLESHGGLAIDSAALFLLIQSIDSASGRAKACRAWLRARRGQVTSQDAIDWLEQNS